MNSKTAITKVGRKKSHRDALQLNLLNDLIVYEHMTTTKAKSRLVLGAFDKVLAIATGTKSAFEKERTLKEWLKNENAVAKVLEVFVKRFAEEKSGLVKTYKLGNRHGDNAEMVKLIVKGYAYKEVGKNVEDKPAKKAAKEKKQEAAGVPVQKDLSQKSQLTGNTSAAKAKTRSGI